MMRAWLTDAPIDVGAVLDSVGAPADGAVALFLGTVREQNDGRAVTGMRYDAYTGMAERELALIAVEATQLLGTDRLAVVHRLGDLGVGDVSVAIAVSSPHREQVFAACRFIIEEIKRRVPIWKHEHYVAGAPQWLTGVVPPGAR